MKHASIANGVVVGIYAVAQSFPTIEIPDHVQLGWMQTEDGWEAPPATGKRWPNSAAFLSDFTLAELAALELSTNPTLAALRLLLSVWPGEVWEGDTRIQLGFTALVDAGILTAERRTQLLTPTAP